METRYLMCERCGHRLRRVKDLDGYWDGETYACDYCSDDDDDFDGEERLSDYDAELIYRSSGEDEDYDFR